MIGSTNSTRNYKVVRRYFKSGKIKTLGTGLTKQEALNLWYNNDNTNTSIVEIISK